MSLGITLVAAFAWGVYCRVLTRWLGQPSEADHLATLLGVAIIVFGPLPPS